MLSSRLPLGRLRINSGLLLFAVAALLPGCVSTARMYDLADGTLIEAKYTQSGTGKGTIEIPLPSGEICKGDYLTIAPGTTSWGRVYYGVGGSNSRNSARFSATSNSDQQYGTALVIGNRGTVIQCEYVLELFKGGYGYCSDNRERRYQIRF